MKNIKFLSKQGAKMKPNEDKITIIDNAAWVIDGATGLTGNKITEKQTDALWYVESLDNYLRNNINSSKEIKEIIKDAIIEIRKQYSKCEGFGNLEEVDYPCAALALVRFNNKELEYYSIGDCTLIYSTEGGNTAEILDKRLEKLEEKNLEKMYKVSKINNISILEARKHCNDEFIALRDLKNKDNGYWILELNENAIDRGICGKVSIYNKLSICMISDGFSQYYDTFSLAKDYKEFINLLKDNPLEVLYKNLYEEQENDSNCNKYPRFKKRDDTSIVYFEL